MAWCGVWKVEGVSPYVGIRLGGIGCNYGGPLTKNTTKISWKSSRVDKVGCTCAVSCQKQVQSALDQWQGSWGVFFTSFQNVPVFGPKRARYTCYWTLPVFFCPVPCNIFALLFSFPPIDKSIAQIRGHTTGSSPPSLTTARALHFYRERISILSSVVNSRRIAPTHARRSQHLIVFYF